MYVVRTVQKLYFSGKIAILLYLYQLKVVTCPKASLTCNDISLEQTN